MKIYLASRQDSPLVTDRQVVIDRLRQHGEASFVERPRDADIIFVVEQYSYKTWRYLAALRACPLLRHSADRVLTLNHDDAARTFLPGLYTSVERKNFDPRLQVACAYPETPHPELEQGLQGGDAPSSARLATFRGMLRSSTLRSRLYEQWKGDPRFRLTVVDQPLFHHATHERAAFLGDICDSQFVLCPRGWAPTTYRLFEAMALGRCPVILSDEWVPVQGVDWGSCSIQVAERDVPNLAEVLERRRAEAAALGRSARLVWEAHFSEPSRYRRYVQMAEQLAQQGYRAEFKELEERWRSRAFRLQHGWTLPQRLASRWARLSREYRERTQDVGS